MRLVSRTIMKMLVLSLDRHVKPCCLLASIANISWNIYQPRTMSNVAILRNPLLLVIKKDYSLWFALLKLSTKMRFLREFCHSSWLINTWALFASICSCELVDACNHFAAQQQNMRPLIHSLRCQAKFRSDEDMSRNNPRWGLCMKVMLVLPMTWLRVQSNCLPASD